MRNWRVKLRPGEAQFRWRCKCGASSEGVAQAAKLPALFSVLNEGHLNGDAHKLEIKTREYDKER